MKENPYVYIPPSLGFYKPPLDRFIPRLPKGVVKHWLGRHAQPGEIILDPIGANPFVPIEAGSNGYRVLSARNNPILWLMTEVLSANWSVQDLELMKNRFLLHRWLDETFADHLQKVYESNCASCGASVQPEGYIWDRDKGEPISKIYACPNCGDEGEREISENDIESLSRLGSAQMHRNRAYHRVLQGGEYEQESINSALDCYLPRALFVTMTLVNVLEGLQLEKTEKQLARALLLPVFDAANSIWYWPSRDHRPLALSVPAVFLEKNLWLALEASPKQWISPSRQVPLNYWPNLPPGSGGICLYNRRKSEQPEITSQNSPAAIVSVLPRPNQAFWTLSALWSGWLWGPKAVIPMRSALKRRHYDWQWFAQAINATFNTIVEKIPYQTPLFGIFPHATPNHFLGSLVGCVTSGVATLGGGYHAEIEETQIEYRKADPIIVEGKIEFKELIENYLIRRGEPADFNQILFNNLIATALEAHIPSDINKLRESLFRSIQEETAKSLADRHIFLSIEDESRGSSKYWLVDSRKANPPLSERIEKHVQEIFLEKVELDMAEVDYLIQETFKGNLIPGSELIKVCTNAVANPINDSSSFHLRDEEATISRNKDFAQMQDILKQTAKIIGVHCAQENGDILWQNSENKKETIFHIIKTSPKVELLNTIESMQNHDHIIIFPGSRSRLFLLRMQEDPRLTFFQQANVHLLKYRHVRWLAQREGLNLELWQELLDSDPPRWDAPEQIQLI